MIRNSKTVHTFAGGLALQDRFSFAAGSIAMPTRFRPCIDLHGGHVKQIIGGSLTDDSLNLRTNFVATLVYLCVVLSSNHDHALESRLNTTPACIVVPL